MKCIVCHVDNKRSLKYCEKCGAPLPVIKRSGFFKAAVGVGAMVILFALIGRYADMQRPPSYSALQLSESQREISQREEGNQERINPEGSPMTGKAAVTGQSESRKEKEERAALAGETLQGDRENQARLTTGWVQITDPWGRQVRRFRSALAGNGWLALPARACYGGKSWRFYSDSGENGEISGGLWIFGDKVGFWQLAAKGGMSDGPELAPWNEKEPVSWVSLESTAEYNGITLLAGLNMGYFLSSPLPDFINESGIFLQGDRIVGWSFGEFLPEAYMWSGEAGTNLEYKTWVQYFYNITFANGREEKFSEALAMKESRTGLDQLSSFVDGFALKPKLSTGDTPDYLLPEKILKRMGALTKSVVQRGDGARVLSVLNSQVLKNLEDIPLLIEVVPAILAAGGYEAAIAEIEETGAYLVQKTGDDAPGLDSIHLELYQQWLNSLVDDNTFDEGWQVFTSARYFYPDDPLIHLLGVELALMNNDWEEAERLLYMKNYPASFQDRFELLASEITEMKGQEEKIVISFPHGSSRIPVTAMINEAVDQNFIIDTGASMVTVPLSTVEALGLKKVPGQRTLWTASGVVTVNEVIIDQIEVNGWVEYNVRALVLDMPDQQGLGLLGLNYLGRFQMDLRPDEGTLLLTPR